MGANSGQPLGYSRFRMQHFQKIWTTQETTNSYVDLGTYWDKTGFHYATIQIWNTGLTNDVYIKILGSLNNSDYDIEVLSETLLGENTYVLNDLSNMAEGTYIPYIKIQIKSAVADNHSTVKAFAVCI